MANQINAADAMIKVMEEWGIKQIFGLPGGSLDSTMNALHNRQSTMQFVQVRHEETAALAAVGVAKVTGKIGAMMGSAGPGAVHLLNGMYDAREDHVPVVAIVGQVATGLMNTGYFQEIDENPIFADVAVFNRTVMTASQMPLVMDAAIRAAYAHNGVAVVTIPTNLGWEEIPDTYESSARGYQRPALPAPEVGRVDQAIAIMKSAKHPIIYVGQGSRGASAEILALSRKLQAPIVITALAKDVIPDDAPENMGSAGRVATKPGVEVASGSDAALFLGSNMPFQKYYIKPETKYIQVDIDATRLGSKHRVDVAIQADVKQTVQMMLDRSEPAPQSHWFTAAKAAKANWQAWMDSFGDSDVTPLRVEPIFKAINAAATDDAVFQVDVGNVTINGLRYLDTSRHQRFTTSGWYATMGYALPAAIGMQAESPDRQIWSISGDGGFTMVMQDVITQVKYKMPIINVILSNESLGFIEAEQDDSRQPHSGVALQPGVRYGDAATAMGAQGFEVTTLDELKAAFAAIKPGHGPIVINVHTNNERPLPVEQLVLDKEVQGEEAVDTFVKKYHAQGLIPLRQILEQVTAGTPVPEILGD